MTFRSETQENVPVLIPQGRFDAYQTVDLDAWFADVMPQNKFVVIDLSNVNFMDTRAIASLIKWMKRMREKDGDLKLCGLQNPVRIILELSKIDHAFSIYTTRQEAIASCKVETVARHEEQSQTTSLGSPSTGKTALPEDVQIIRLDKRVDAFRIPELQKSFEIMGSQGKRRFVVDLSLVEFLDSAGLALLVKLLKQARAADGQVVLVRSQIETANRILKLTQFNKVFKITDTLDAAINQLLG